MSGLFNFLKLPADMETISFHMSECVIFNITIIHKML